MLCPIWGSSVGERHVGASPQETTKTELEEMVYKEGLRQRAWRREDESLTSFCGAGSHHCHLTKAGSRTTNKSSYVLKKQRQICPQKRHSPTLLLADLGPSAPHAHYLGGHLQP